MLRACKRTNQTSACKKHRNRKVRVHKIWHHCPALIADTITKTQSLLTFSQPCCSPAAKNEPFRLSNVLFPEIVSTI